MLIFWAKSVLEMLAIPQKGMSALSATLLSPKDYYFMVGFDGERSTTVERGSQIPH